MLKMLSSALDSTLSVLDNVFQAKKTEIHEETGLPFSYTCLRCTWIRTLSVGLLSGVGLEHGLEIVNLIKGLFN